VGGKVDPSWGTDDLLVFATKRVTFDRWLRARGLTEREASQENIAVWIPGERHALHLRGRQTGMEIVQDDTPVHSAILQEVALSNALYRRTFFVIHERI
jgi:hypothetical protein